MIYWHFYPFATSSQMSIDMKHKQNDGNKDLFVFPFRGVIKLVKIKTVVGGGGWDRSSLMSVSGFVCSQVSKCWFFNQLFWIMSVYSDGKGPHKIRTTFSISMYCTHSKTENIQYSIALAVVNPLNQWCRWWSGQERSGGSRPDIPVGGRRGREGRQLWSLS